jgi:hypothetical protein
VKKAFTFDSKKAVKFKKNKQGITLFFDETPCVTGYIVEIVTK